VVKIGEGLRGPTETPSFRFITFCNIRVFKVVLFRVTVSLCCTIRCSVCRRTSQRGVCPPYW